MKIPYEILYPDLPLIKHSQNETLRSLKKGEVEEIRISSQKPLDDIIRFGLSNNFLKESLCSFPDPRQGFDIPIDILLLPQIIQRLDDEHSLVSAPYMLNSSELITRLGYSAKVLETGFNNKNKHERETIFHGETLKHLLLSTKADHLITWFNENWCIHLQKQAPGRTHTYLLDGTRLIIPSHLVEKYQNAGTVKNPDGTIECGYKIVWLRELIDEKRITRGMLIAPINEHDLPLGKKLIDNFLFEKDATLIMDRGFLDGDWIKKLREERKMQVTIPLKKNSEITQFAVAQAEVDNKWKPHPTRKDQEVYKLSRSDLLWETCPVFESGVLVRFKKKDGILEHIVFVSTKKNVSPAELLGEYDLRFEIEEDHRQLKCFQGIENLPSKKYVNVVFRIVMGIIAYDLFNLFLNSEECDSLESYTLKLKRQKHREEKNPEVIIYAEETFAILNYYDFLDLLLSLPKKIQTILRKNFKKISSE